MIELCVGEQLTIAEVARRLGVYKGTVVACLDAYGMPRRGSRPPPWPGEAMLVELYVEKRLEIAEAPSPTSASYKRAQRAGGARFSWPLRASAE